MKYGVLIIRVNKETIYQINNIQFSTHGMNSKVPSR